MLPLHGFRRLVVLADVAHEFSLEIRDGSENTVCHHVALDLVEPQIDLVRPGPVAGSEVQLNLRMRDQEIFDRLSLVRQEIVGDHVDLFSVRLVDHDVGEESDELRGGMAFSRLAQHFVSAGVEGRVERQGAMAEVVESVAFSSAREQRRHRVFVIQGLNIRLLIDTEHRRVCCRVQI